MVTLLLMADHAPALAQPGSAPSSPQPTSISAVSIKLLPFWLADPRHINQWTCWLRGGRACTWICDQGSGPPPRPTGHRTVQRSQGTADPVYRGFGAVPPPAALHFLSSYRCQLAWGMQPSLSSSLWTEFSVVYPLCIPIWTTFWSPAPPPRNTRIISISFFPVLRTMASTFTPASVLCATSLNFLGFHVDSQGICPMEDKVQAIRDFPLPLTA